MAYTEVNAKLLRDIKAWPTANLKSYLLHCRKEAHGPVHNKGRRMYQASAQAAETELARRLGEDWEQTIQ